MTHFSKKPIDQSKIGNHPKIKLLKKNARQRSPIINLESQTSFQDLDKIMGSVVDNILLNENHALRHLRGKYERFTLNKGRNLIHKDILVIQPNGKIVLRTTKSIFHGEARYILNALLQINIENQNNELPIALTMLAYVGRYEIQDIKCLHTLTMTSAADHSPVSNYEILVPVVDNNAVTVPLNVEIDSLDFVKLKHRYPELYPCLLRRLNSTPSKVDW
jgi:hypothetical protein